MNLPYPVIDPESGQVIIEKGQEFKPSAELIDQLTAIRYSAAINHRPNSQAYETILNALGAICHDMPESTYYVFYDGEYDHHTDDLEQALKWALNWSLFVYPRRPRPGFQLIRVTYPTNAPWEWAESEELLMWYDPQGIISPGSVDHRITDKE